LPAPLNDVQIAHRNPETAQFTVLFQRLEAFSLNREGSVLHRRASKVAAKCFLIAAPTRLPRNWLPANH